VAGGVVAVHCPAQRQVGNVTTGESVDLLENFIGARFPHNFRVRSAQGVPSGDYTYQLFVAVGTAQECADALTKLRQLTTR